MRPARWLLPPTAARRGVGHDARDWRRRVGWERSPATTEPVFGRKHAIRGLTLSGVAIAGVAATSIVIGHTGDPPPIAAVAESPGAVTPSVVHAAANPEFAEFGMRVTDAVEIPAPDAATTKQPWWIIPADHGACFSPGDGGLVCGTTAQLRAGRVFLLELPLRPMKNGQAGGVDSTTPLRIAGLVPDSVASVIATAVDGRVLGRASVRNGVYEVPLDKDTIKGLPSTLESIELRGADGSVTAKMHANGAT